MPPSTVGPPFDRFLATAEAVARARPEVDLGTAREVSGEAATLLHDGMALERELRGWGGGRSLPFGG